MTTQRLWLKRANPPLPGLLDAIPRKYLRPKGDYKQHGSHRYARENKWTYTNVEWSKCWSCLRMAGFRHMTRRPRYCWRCLPVLSELPA
jgi:hypothetical protein